MKERTTMSPTTSFRSDIHLHSEQSGGVLSVTENRMPAGAPGPPLHRHDFDEAFYVLEGELTFQVEDALITAGPGEFAFAPRGVAHTLANQTGEPARYLLLCTPAGFERVLARRMAAQAGEDPPAWALADGPEVVVVGPRIGERA
jgi:quercetin dioxygenase-like cupin family protein